MLKFFIFIFLFSCNADTPKTNWKNFEGRLVGTSIYRACIPNDWVILAPESPDYLADTTLPIISFNIPSEDICITVHNFPTQNIEESISPQWQINRWQKQFAQIDATSMQSIPLIQGGFIGYLFEANGTIKNKPKSILAAAMQIIPEHYRSLQHDVRKELEYKQMRADYTIKAVGSPESIKNKREEIVSFIESFELIHAIPSTL